MTLEYTFDLHFHSCLSPCGDGEMTPANLAAMCALAGLDIVALTDHNTTGNCRAFLAAAEENGILALPGMELTCLEEVHVVCLFPELEGAEAFGALVASRLPPLPNDPAIFGPQVLMDHRDTVLGEETAMLAAATTIGVYEAAELVRSFGGLAYPAHIDRPSFSLLSNLGLWDPGMGFSLAEVSHACPPDLFDRRDLRGVPHITASDAHYLHQVSDPCQSMSLPRLSRHSAVDYLRRPGC